MERKMFLGANHATFENAKNLRNNQTKSEHIIWNYLKDKPCGLKFRRQHPINVFIADFYCHALKLIIEVDGKIHENKDIKRYDKERQQFLEDQGINFIRVSNDEIEKDFDSVKNKIENYLKNAKVNDGINNTSF